MLDLTGHMIIWGELFAHGEGSTGLMKVVFCYALPTVGGLRVERAHCHGIFGLSDYHQERTVKGKTTPDSYTPELYNVVNSKRLFRQFHGLRCRQT
jgi:hypothetical protein